MRDIIGEIGGAHRKAAQQLAAREDVLPNEHFRQALSGLFDDNPARAKKTIEDQVRCGLRSEDVSLERILKVGTIGEVSVIRLLAPGTESPGQYASKTISIEQRELFRTDFETFKGGLMGTLNGALKIVESVSDKAALVRPLVQQVVNIGSDAKFQANTMSEFDLHIEACNMEDGAEWLRAAAADREGYFRVPKVLQVSEEGDVMLMELVREENLNDAAGGMSDAEKSGVAKDLLEIFIHGLILGPVLHTDLHPGNVLWSRGRPGLTVVDWGLVVRVPAEHRRTIGELLRHLAVATAPIPPKVFADLGVRMRSDPKQLMTEEQCRELGKFFDVAAGASGQLNISSMLRAMHQFEWPDWMVLWQKSTGALVNTLVHLKLSDTIDIRAKIGDLVERMINSTE